MEQVYAALPLSVLNEAVQQSKRYRFINGAAREVRAAHEFVAELYQIVLPDINLNRLRRLGHRMVGAGHAVQRLAHELSQIPLAERLAQNP